MFAEKWQKNFLVVEVCSISGKSHVAQVIAFRGCPAAVNPGAEDDLVGGSGVELRNGVKNFARPHEIFRVKPTAHGEYGAMHVFHVRGNVAGFPVLIVVSVNDLIVPIRIGVPEVQLLSIGEGAHMQVKIIAIGGAVIEAWFVSGRGDFRARLEKGVEAKIGGEHEGAVVISIVAHVKVSNWSLG